MIYIYYWLISESIIHSTGILEQRVFSNALPAEKQIG